MAPHPRWLNAGRDCTWQNLGDWQTATTYPEAAAALAERLGSAMSLGPGDRVVDVGCGSGDQLALWRQRFQVAEVIGLEPDPDNAARATRWAEADDAITVTPTGDTHLETLSAQPTAVLSLDAAYHFGSRQAFVQRAANALRPGGRLGVTDLFVPATPDLRARLLAWGAGIPQRNLWSEARWRAALTEAGFGTVHFEDATEAVLGGFGRYGRSGWGSIDQLSINATAWASKDAARRGWLGYAVVVATRTES